MRAGITRKISGDEARNAAASCRNNVPALTGGCTHCHAPVPATLCAILAPGLRGVSSTPPFSSLCNLFFNHDGNTHRRLTSSRV